MSTKRLSEESNSDKIDGSNVWVYDIETYPNLFLALFKELNSERTGRLISFQDSNLQQMKEFLTTEGLILIGYNNFGFDDVVLKAILDCKVVTAEEIYTFATRVLNHSGKDDKEIWRLTYFQRQEWEGRTSPWGCIDLFQILGGKVRAGSLKSQEVRLGLPNVKDLPFKPGTSLTSEQTTELVRYCENDVIATEALYYDIEPLIEVRVAVRANAPNLKPTTTSLLDSRHPSRL